MSPRVAQERTYEIAARHYEQALVEVADTEDDPVTALSEAFMRIGAAQMDEAWKAKQTLDAVARKHSRGRK